jgi:hypothetical protein
LADGHMVDERLPPVGVSILRESKAGAGEDELIIVVVESKGVHEVGGVIDQSEVHAGYCEDLGLVGVRLVLSVES